MNTYGKLFRVHVFGESHGELIGVTIDGCPAGIDLTADDFSQDLARRRGGRTGTTPREEPDTPELISGIYNNKTTGAPITILFRNTNVKSDDYSHLKCVPRPGHADYTASIKYNGYNDPRGGGHFSGRLTLGIVAAGVIAKKMIPFTQFATELLEAGGNKNIAAAVSEALQEEDSIGGLIECRISKVPKGLGEPFFTSVESCLSSMMFSIPAIKGIEFGSGFASAKMKGSEHNDRIIDKFGKTTTNNSGGIHGGITNGNDIVFRVAVKPTPSINKSQITFNFEKQEEVKLKVGGRHDTCIALRIPVIVENAAAIVLADLSLIAGAIDTYNPYNNTEVNNGYSNNSTGD